MTLATLGEKLFMNSEYANVLLVCDDEEIPASREIVSAASSHLKNVLSENKSNKVIINNIPVKHFKEIIRYVYLGHIKTLDWSMEHVLDLLALARNYQYDEVVSQVVIDLEKRHLDFDTWDLLLSAAIRHDLDILKSKCASFSEEKISEFINLQNLEQFKANFIVHMFESPKIQSCNQDVLLEALLEWKEIHSVDQIKNVLSKINWVKVSPTILVTMAKDYFEQIPNIDNSSFWSAVSENRTKRNEKPDDVATNDSICPVTTAASILFGVQQGDSLFSSNMTASGFKFMPPKGLSPSHSGMQKPSTAPDGCVLNDNSSPTALQLPCASSEIPRKIVSGKRLLYKCVKSNHNKSQIQPVEPIEGSKCIARLDRDMLLNNSRITLQKFQCFLQCSLREFALVLDFLKDSKLFEIPVRSIEWESSRKYNVRVSVIKFIEGNRWTSENMLVSEPMSNNKCFKYSASFSKSTPVCAITIVFPYKSVKASVDKLRNIVIT